MKRAAKYWSYQPEHPTPDVIDLPSDAFRGTQAEWESLTPGMRREIYRDCFRRLDTEQKAYAEALAVLTSTSTMTERKGAE